MRPLEVYARNFRTQLRLGSGSSAGQPCLCFHVFVVVFLKKIVCTIKLIHFLYLLKTLGHIMPPQL